jgi:glutamyl/glutaminyl-tRNA synthetase
VVKAVLLDSVERDLVTAREAVFGWMAARTGKVPLLLKDEDPVWRQELTWLGLDFDAGPAPERPGEVLRVRDADRPAPPGPLLRLPALREAQGWSLTRLQGQGALGSAVLAFLASLGWPDRPNRSYLSRIELLRQFRPGELDPSPVCLDFAGFTEIQRHFMEELTPAELLDFSFPFWREQGVLDEEPQGELRRNLEGLALLFSFELTWLTEFPQRAAFLVREPPPLGDPRLSTLALTLEKVRPWDSETLLEALGDLEPQTWEAAERALTGYSPTPGLPEILAMVGREVSLRRLKA